MTAPISGHDLPLGRPGPQPGIDETLTLSFDDNRLLAQLFGEHDEYLALVEHRLGVDITPRGNRVAVRGGAEARGAARRALSQLYERARKGLEISRGDVEGAIRMSKEDGTPAEANAVSTRRKLVVPRTQRQRRLCGGDPQARAGVRHRPRGHRQDLSRRWPAPRTR